MIRGQSSPRIFQIGFNRCGTTTLILFFQANNLKCLHWGRGSIAAGIEAAYLEGKPLLSYTDGYFVYGDMEFVEVESEYKKIFKKKPFRRLYKNLPKDKFILNTRNMEEWVNSRIRFLDRGYFYCKHGDKYHSSQKELNLCWRKHWNQHISEVKEYFLERPEDLLEFDLDKDGPEKIADFFSDLNLDISKWGHHNKSK